MYHIDFVKDTAITWNVGGQPETHHNYHPTLYAAAADDGLAELQEQLAGHDAVAATAVERHKTFWKQEPEQVLRIDAATIDDATRIGNHVRRSFQPGRYRLYNVDLSPKFRFCLETGQAPVPDHEPTMLRLEADTKQVSEGDITCLDIGGDTYTGSEQDILAAVEQRLDAQDPDLLVVSHAQLIPLLHDTATELGREDFNLGRAAGYTQLAGASSYESYGQVGHSPARYNVMGRAVINQANSFFLDHTNLDGLWYLVRRSWKPVQEAAWASIGTVLTAIQIRYALDNDVLIPWRAWTPEQPKSAATLHQADRGGFTFSPDVGVHEDVYEVDYSSLYPWIIVTRNLSPETVRCPCHDTDDVPDLDYSVCEQDGYLGEVLRPLLEDREGIKAELREKDEQERIDTLQGKSDAIKWILVSCFGYQGFSNSKWGQLRVHEAINAYAREILLDAKEVFEQNGYRVVHGIVDSIWVQPREGEQQTPIEDVCSQVSEEAGIRLDREHHYDWIAFCPKRETGGGALTRYFGKHRDGFKVRGIEARQRSTPPYIEDSQRAMLDLLDRHHDPDAVIDFVQRQIHRLETGAIDPERLVITKRISREPDEYTQSIKSAAAVKRARELHNHEVKPGTSVEYVVVDDEQDGIGRVRLPYEETDGYDAGFYRDQLFRATASVLSPFGWDRNDVTEAVAETSASDLRSFLEVTP